MSLTFVSATQLDSDRVALSNSETENSKIIPVSKELGDRLIRLKIKGTRNLLSNALNKGGDLDTLAQDEDTLIVDKVELIASVNTLVGEILTVYDAKISQISPSAQFFMSKYDNKSVVNKLDKAKSEAISTLPTDYNDYITSRDSKMMEFIKFLDKLLSNINQDNVLTHLAELTEKLS